MTVQTTELAPVALFVYKRPQHAHRMISSVLNCVGFDESPIFVFADGPAHPRDAANVAHTRQVVRDLLGERAVYVERGANLGVDRSVIEGVTQLCDRFGRVVVVEDDLVVSPDFLQFLNNGLRQFEHEPRVLQVSGHMFDVPELREQNDAIFLPMITSWGWATWKRAWDLFDPKAYGWQEVLRDDRVRRQFDLDGHFGYSAMLARQMRREVAAWDIRWYFTVFARGGLTLFPPRSLVLNTGLDGSGTHERLGLPARQAPLERNAKFELPVQASETTLARHVYEAISQFRPASTRAKMQALLGLMTQKVAASFKLGRR